MSDARVAPEGRVGLLFHPWAWMLTGLTACLAAWGWVRVLDDPALLVPGLLVTFGLVCCGVALALRLNTPGGAYVERLPAAARSRALLALGLGCSGLVVLSFAFLTLKSSELDLPWGYGALTAAALLAAGVGGPLALVCFTRDQAARPLTRWHEAALLLLLTAACAWFSAWAFYLGEAEAGEWDTMRLFFTIFAMTAALGAGLALLPPRFRMAAVSVAVVVHFGGILCAILSVSPVPWMVEQLWPRFYRPYLQFMYLNNAYQFYAPNPSPDGYLWFRLEYESADGGRYWEWFAEPRVAEDGSVGYTPSLRFQRRIAMVQTTGFPDSSATLTTVSDPRVYWRTINSDIPKNEKLKQAQILGFSPEETALPQPDYEIPFHPTVNPFQQYVKPATFARQLLKSFARHIASREQPKHPGDMLRHVKIYRVIHAVPSPLEVITYNGPWHMKALPVYYQPYYMGKFSPQGELLDEFQVEEVKGDDGRPRLKASGDPLQYWMTPILPEDPDGDGNSVIRAYVYKHAGDREWVYYPPELYVQEERSPPPRMRGQ